MNMKLRSKKYSTLIQTDTVKTRQFESLRDISRLHSCLTWSSVIIPQLYKVCQSVYAYIAGNPRNAKSCDLVTHVNLVTSSKVIDHIFDLIIHSCVDLNPYSFCDVILIKKV